MKGDEDFVMPPSSLRDEELSILQKRTRQLEACRGRITAKKVYLKHKKVSCSPDAAGSKMFLDTVFLATAVWYMTLYAISFFFLFFLLGQEICIVNHNKKIQQRQESSTDRSSLQVRQQLTLSLFLDMHNKYSCTAYYVGNFVYYSIQKTSTFN